MTNSTDQAGAGAPADAEETVSISRVDYETLRAVASSALAASAALSAIARLQTTSDGESFEIAISADVEGALERADEALGPMQPSFVTVGGQAAEAVL